MPTNWRVGAVRAARATAPSNNRAPKGGPTIKNTKNTQADFTPGPSPRSAVGPKSALTIRPRGTGFLHRRAPLQCASLGSQRNLQLDLVADRDAVCARGRDVGHQRADHVDGAGVDVDDAEAAALVEAEGVEVVVGHDGAQQRRALLAAELQHGVEQGDTDPALVADVVERREIDHRPLDEPGRHAGQFSVVVGGERLHVRRVHDPPAQHQGAPAPPQAQQLVEKGAVVDRADVERNWLLAHLDNSLKPRRMSRAVSAPSPASRTAAAIAAAAWG